MSSYQHILAAVAIDDNGAAVLKRAQALARRDGSRLSVMHVIEYLPIESGELLMTTPYDMTRQLEEQAREKLQKICDALGLSQTTVLVTTGPVVTQIETQARKLDADLIVVGHQPRTGLAAWFSHIEDNLVHRAPCDVLVLRLS